MRMEKKCFDDQFQCSALSKEKIDALVDIGFTWARPKKGAKLQQEKIGVSHAKGGPLFSQILGENKRTASSLVTKASLSEILRENNRLAVLVRRSLCMPSHRLMEDDTRVDSSAAAPPIGFLMVHK